MGRKRIMRDEVLGATRDGNIVNEFSQGSLGFLGKQAIRA
jgi:hypothetical protein